MAEIEPLVATVVTVAKDEPYPTGSPTDISLASAKRAQELTTAAKWESQRVANLLAHGMIAGGAAVP